MKLLADSWRAPARAAPAYAVAALLGLVVNVLAFGFDHLVGTSGYWDLPLSDSREYMIGYRHFLHEPWHWPIFESHTINAPYTKSVAFTDSIPLWAALNKAIATIAPPWGRFTMRAYLGLWHGLVYALQACLGVAILRALGHRTWAATLATALLFLALPMWIWRYEHASLEAHFLTLWALLLYLRSPSAAAGSQRLRAAQMLQLGVATLINPYHTVMSFGLFVASVLRSRKIGTIAAWLPAGASTVFLGAWLAGYLAKEATLPMPGFDTSSANVLSPLVPLRSGILGDGRAVANVVAAPHQYEGSAYLGLGVLVLVALLFLRARDVGAAIKRHPFLFALAVGAWLFSLSNHVWIGGREVVSFGIPERLRWVTEQYRAPGRFIWLPLYVVLVFAWKSALERFSVGLKALVVPALVVLQLVDASGEWRSRRPMTRGPYRPLLDHAAWRSLAFAHESVFVLPSYDCILDGTPDIDLLSQEVHYIASERALSINGMYSCRPTRDCGRDALEWTTMRPRERVLYVFLSRVEKIADRFVMLGARCGAFRYGRVCSMRTDVIDAAITAGTLSPPPPPPPLSAGEKLVFGAGAPPAFFGETHAGGWSYREETGRWSDGVTAHVIFRFAGTVPETPTFHVEASSVICGDRRSQDVDVLLGGAKLGTLHFDEHANDAKVARSLPVDPALLARRVLDLELRPRDTRPAREVGCNADARHLGIWVQRMWFE